MRLAELTISHVRKNVTRDSEGVMRGDVKRNCKARNSLEHDEFCMMNGLKVAGFRPKITWAQIGVKLFQIGSGGGYQLEIER